LPHLRPGRKAHFSVKKKEYKREKEREREYE
jgi:hypothetical protein